MIAQSERKTRRKEPENKKTLSLAVSLPSLSKKKKKTSLSFSFYAFFTQSAIAAARYGALAALNPASEILPSLVM